MTKHRWHSWRTASAFALGAFVLAAAATFPGHVQAQDNSPLVVNIAQAPATLDPAWACGLSEVGFLQNFYVRLTQYAEKPGPGGTTQIDTGKIVPYFAKSIDISPDGLVYTVKLPAGIKFPSGAPVDSQAVKYSFERLLKMNGCGAYFILDGFYTPPLVEKMETPDPTTFIMTLSRPDPNTLQLWVQPAASIVDKTVVDANGGIEAGTPNEYMAGHVAGSGPFLLAEYEPNNRAVLKANPDFFGAKPGADTIIVNWINSDPTLLLQARNGTADITLGMAKNSVNSLKGNADVRIVANETTLSEQLGLPNTKAPWTNVKVRQAVSYAIPYQQILDRVAFGFGVLYGGPFSPGFPQYNPAVAPLPTFDLAKAKQLMAESGLATPVDVEMVIPEGNTIEEQIATIVQGTWRELGINLKIRRLASADYTDSMEGHKVQAYIRLDGPGVIDAGYFLGYDMICGIKFNLTEVCIEKADTLLSQARAEIDDAKRQDLYDQITRLWTEDAPKIHVYGEKFTTVLNKRVTGYHFSHETDLRKWSKR